MVRITIFIYKITCAPNIDYIWAIHYLCKHIYNCLCYINLFEISLTQQDRSLHKIVYLPFLYYSLNSCQLHTSQLSLMTVCLEDKVKSHISWLLTGIKSIFFSWIFLSRLMFLKSSPYLWRDRLKTVSLSWVPISGFTQIYLLQIIDTTYLALSF